MTTILTLIIVALIVSYGYRYISRSVAMNSERHREFKNRIEHKITLACVARGLKIQILSYKDYRRLEFFDALMLENYYAIYIKFPSDGDVETLSCIISHLKDYVTPTKAILVGDTGNKIISLYFHKHGDEKK